MLARSRSQNTPHSPGRSSSTPGRPGPARSFSGLGRGAQEGRSLPAWSSDCVEDGTGVNGSNVVVKRLKSEGEKVRRSLDVS